MTWKCCQPECSKRASFNIPGKPPEWCKDHKTSQMINVRDKKCLTPECNKIPSFSMPGDSPKWCGQHKTNEMINNKTQQCVYCYKKPFYNLPGEKAKYCSDHKLDGMINVLNKKCCELNCEISPNYNYKDLKEPLYCLKHKKLDMIDVRHKKCDEDECQKRAICGIPGNKPNKCITHMTNGQIRKPTRRCNTKKCNNIAVFGFNTIATHCDVHKEENQINLIEGHCSNCGLLTILTETKICELCGHFAEVKKRLLEKQLRIKDLIQKENIEIFSYDSVIDKACNKKRPDIVIDCSTHFIVVEIDEFQHKRGQGYLCENIRMLDIAQALGLNTIFIRYNPDAYKTPKGRIGRESNNKREEKLINTIKIYQKAIPLNFLNVIYLYYDGWKGNIELIELDMTQRFVIN